LPGQNDEALKVATLGRNPAVNAHHRVFAEPLREQHTLVIGTQASRSGKPQSIKTRSARTEFIVFYAALRKRH
jgi:hypothetical protein